MIIINGWDPSVPPFLVRQQHEAARRQRAQHQAARDRERAAALEQLASYPPFARQRGGGGAIDVAEIYRARHAQGAR